MDNLIAVNRIEFINLIRKTRTRLYGNAAMRKTIASTTHYPISDAKSNFKLWIVHLLDRVMTLIYEVKEDDINIDKLTYDAIENFSESGFDEPNCDIAAGYLLKLIHELEKPNKDEFAQTIENTKTEINKKLSIINSHKDEFAQTIENTETEINKKLSIINSHEENAKTKLDEINDLVDSFPLKGFADLYHEEANKKIIESSRWFKYSKRLVFCLLTSVIACFIFNLFVLGKIESKYFVVANEVTFNLILVALVLWCARMYSITKAIEINYKHKSVSSRALLTFISSVGNQNAVKKSNEEQGGNQDEVKDEVRNLILLEASRMIFSEPNTGLTQNNSLNTKILETFKDISRMNQAK